MSALRIDTGDTPQPRQPKPLPNTFTAEDAAITGAALSIPAGVAALEFLTRNYEQYLPEVVKNVEDLAKRLPTRLKGEAKALFDRFYTQPSGPYARNTDLGYIRTKQPAGSSYRDAAGYVTDVKGNRLFSKGAPVPQPPRMTMKPVVSGGVVKLIPTLMKGIGAAGLLYSAYDTTKDLVGSLQRGEGFAAIPKLFSGDEPDGAYVENGTDAFNNVVSNERSIEELRADLDRERAKYQTEQTQPVLRDNPFAPLTTEQTTKPEPKPVATDTLKIEPKPTPKRREVSHQVQPQPTYNPATDARNAAYIAARNKLNASSTAEEIKAVEELGMSIHKDIYG